MARKTRNRRRRKSGKTSRPLINEAVIYSRMCLASDQQEYEMQRSKETF